MHKCKKSCIFAVEMNKKLLILLLLLPYWTYLFASDSTHYELAYRLSAVGGTMMKDGKVDYWINRPVLGGTFAVEFLPTGRWKSLTQWNNTSVGVGTTFLNLGNDAMLGNAIALHAHLNTPFVSLPHFVFGIRPTVGVAFCTKTYRNTLPDKYPLYSCITDNKVPVCNQSIGSVVNAYLGLQLYMDFPIQDGFDITLAYGWQHISNGSVMHPNGGYNMFNGELGLRYTPGLSAQRVANQTAYTKPKTNVPRHLYDGVDKKWLLDIFLTGGVKQNYYRDNYQGMQFFGAATLGVAAFWVPVSIFKLGVGLDAFYDGYYACINDDFISENPDAKHVTYFDKTYLRSSNIANCFRAGISLQPEFIIGKLTAGIHLGVYLYDPIKNLENKGVIINDRNGEPFNRGIFYAYDITNASNFQDGWLYTRFILNYLCTDHLFVQIGLKTHGVRAEFIDAGLGIRI